MRDDIVGMLKNAIEHGANPGRVAQSLVNSGYPQAEVVEALSFVTSTMPSQQGNPQSTITPRSIAQPTRQTPTPQLTPPQTPQLNQPRPVMPTPPIYNRPLETPSPPSFSIKSLPSVKQNPGSSGKLVLMIFILLVLVGSLISVIVFKDRILNLIG